MKIPLEQIAVPDQLRTQPDPDHINTLADSIAKAGLLQPITVTRNKTGYQLICGYHRLQAVKKLGLTEIDAHVISSRGPNDDIALQLTENITRKDMPLQEQVNAIIHLHHVLKIPIRRIAQLCGKSVAWVHRRIDLNGFNDDVKQALYAGKINLTQAELLNTIKDTPTRRMAITHSQQMDLTADELRNVIKTMETSVETAPPLTHQTEPPRPMESPKAPEEHCQLCGRLRSIIELQPILICRPCLYGIDEMKKQTHTEEA